MDAIRSQRPCVPSFVEGANVIRVMDAALESAESGAWVDL
ncbi:MAG: hypothetical protein ABIP20_08705 [Chthoniobacteraceae bacterium]